ncbi:hypothetical protein [Cytobacillus depressus]|uniref:hypothetical protein n=1 Tax=Cytobacillus depressus TaxID=1602942 RepID=UPI0014783D66|nr:hypothetical protein [Cytobacillus depressus]
MKKFFRSGLPFLFLFAALYAMSTLKHLDTLSVKETEQIKSFFATQENGTINSEE